MQHLKKKEAATLAREVGEAAYEKVVEAGGCVMVILPVADGAKNELVTLVKSDSVNRIAMFAAIASCLKISPEHVALLGVGLMESPLRTQEISPIQTENL